MNSSTLVLLLCLVLLPHIVLSVNYIMFFTWISKSMRNVVMPIAEELVARNNTVTIVAAYGSDKLKPGIKEIIIDELIPVIEDLGDTFSPGKIEALYQYKTISLLRKNLLFTCEFLLKHKEIRAILEGKEKFDMAILNLLLPEDCSLGIIHNMNIPFIYVSTAGFPSEYTNNLRMPWCMSYCPIFTMTDYTNKMNFFERLDNTITSLMVSWLREHYFATSATKYLREHLDPNMPSVLDIERNISLIILNDHFSLTYPQPLLPNVVQVSGMHCRPPKPLPKEIEEWVSGGGDAGFIYFSLGTFARADKIPEPYRTNIINVLSKLPQRVIWKLNKPFEDLPPNVKSFKWLPQQDLLGHPRIRLFITHGGLFSQQEAVYHGVPVLGMPTSVDQPYNLRKNEDSGTGIMLKWSDFTEEKFYSAIKKLTTDPSYKENIAKRKAISQDLQNSSLETAVYWIEYVLRHKGAHHLRSGGLSLSWYQYYQVDVWGFLIGCVLFSLWVIKKVIQSVFRLLFKRKPRKHRKKD